MDQQKEIQMLKKRFEDLANKAYTQNIFTFTDFLGLSEQDEFWKAEASLRYAGVKLYGGIENADRVMIRFGDAENLGYEVDFPIVCVHIMPLLAKFAQNLSHRDFLGALMNLGIERSALGDIKVGDKEAFLFCKETIAPFICENLSKIAHTNVKCVVTQDYKQFVEEEPEPKLLQVASLRLDAVLAKVYNISRGDCLQMFQAGKVFVNGRLCENNSKQLKDGEVVNLRGYGKFIFVGGKSETRKGKLNVEVRIYR